MKKIIEGLVDRNSLLMLSNDQRVEFAQWALQQAAETFGLGGDTSTQLREPLLAAAVAVMESADLDVQPVQVGPKPHYLAAKVHGVIDLLVGVYSQSCTTERLSFGRWCVETAIRCRRPHNNAEAVELYTKLEAAAREVLRLSPAVDKPASD